MKRLLIAFLLLILTVLIVSSCGKDKIETIDATALDEALIVSADGFEVNGNDLSASVENDTETFSFLDRIVVSAGATWQISTDVQGREPVPTKAVSLIPGDNVFYILVTSGSGKTLSLYTVTVTRAKTGSETEPATEPVTEPDNDFDLVSEKDPTFDYFHADLSSYFTITREDYAGRTVAIDVTEEEVDEYLSVYLLPSYRKPKTATGRAVENGDTVYIYYTGYIDDVAFDGGSNADDDEPYPLVIGSGSFIPGFEEGLIGVIPSETSSEDPHPTYATFPENYRNADLAGKEARFDVWIVGILDGYDVPELTAEFVTDVLGFETEEADAVAAFRAELRNDMRENKATYLTGRKIDRVINDLVSALEWADALPAGEAERKEAAMNEDFEYYYMIAPYYGYNFDSLDEFGAWYYGRYDWQDFQTEEAKREVRQTMILNAVARLEGVEITEEDAKEWIRDLASSNDATPADVLAYYSVEEIYSMIACEKAQDILFELIDFDYGDLFAYEEEEEPGPAVTTAEETSPAPTAQETEPPTT